jgi:hypothetical protein
VVFSWFKEFKSLLGNQPGRKNKVSSNDNSGECCSTEFDMFYKKNGIE